MGLLKSQPSTGRPESEYRSRDRKRAAEWFRAETIRLAATYIQNIAAVKFEIEKDIFAGLKTPVPESTKQLHAVRADTFRAAEKLAAYLTENAKQIARRHASPEFVEATRLYVEFLDLCDKEEAARQMAIADSFPTAGNA